jgi:hypothetical protein
MQEPRGLEVIGVVKDGLTPALKKNEIFVC